VAKVEEHLLCKHINPEFNLQSHKNKRVQGQVQLHGEFKVSLDYITRPCLKVTTTTTIITIKD
jgi:hypothetical protein